MFFRLNSAQEPISGDQKYQEKRRKDKSARDKRIQDALDKLVTERDEAKKKLTADEKKPGTQAILDALK